MQQRIRTRDWDIVVQPQTLSPHMVTQDRIGIASVNRDRIRARLSRCPIKVWTIVGCVAVGAVMGVGTMVAWQVVGGVR